MKVAFRVDASETLGSGHISRCLNLATALKSRGAECVFIGRRLRGHQFRAISDAGFRVLVIPRETEMGPTRLLNTISDPVANSDALLTMALLGGEKPDWLIVDHYGIDAKWESVLRPHVGKILIIDDLAEVRHDCDVLLNQNFSTSGPERYNGLVTQETELRLGPRYALLHPDFARRRKDVRIRLGGPPVAFISFGGSDPDNITELVLNVLGRSEFSDVIVHVAIGANNRHRLQLEQWVRSRGSGHSHFDPANMAEIMHLADFAIGAGGATIWERICLDLPSIVVSISMNQVPTCVSLALAGQINYLGHATEFSADKLSGAIVRLLGGLGETRLEPQIPLVDGLGTERVADMLLPHKPDAS